MNDATKTYYLRMAADLSRELRHRCVETGTTMNAEIVKAIRSHLDSTKASDAQAVGKTTGQ
jgi:hypothetical protein